MAAPSPVNLPYRKCATRLREDVIGWLGVLAIVFFCAHAVFWVLDGRAQNLLWVCHLADLCVGVGLLLRWRTLNAMGLLLLCIGVPMWLVNLAAGASFFPTSMLTHVGGLVVGFAGWKMLGAPQRIWWKAFLLVILLLVLSRCTTPVEMNVNLVFATWPVVPTLPPSYELHLAALLGLWALALWTAEWGLTVFSLNPEPEATTVLPGVALKQPSPPARG